MKYEAILLDADDTLLDFKKAEDNALDLLFSRLSIQDKSLKADYKRININCWLAYEKGELSQAELRTRRFQEFFRLHALPNSPEEAAICYEKALSLQSCVLPGALEAVRAISEKLPIVIVTNGITTTQRPRFQNSPLFPYVKDVMISEEVGASKPHPLIIHKALSILGNPPKDRVLMIGDSLSSDMMAAQNAGIDFLWFNAAKKPRPRNARITYETDSISEFVRYAFMN